MAPSSNGTFESYTISLSLLCSAFVLLSILAGCSVFQDPSAVGQTAPAHDKMWRPAGATEVTLPSEERAEIRSFRGEKLNLANIIDFALRFNPKTKQTWAQARLAAFEVGFRKSPYYPQVQFTETMTYDDISLTHASLEAIAEDPAGILVDPGYTKSITEDLTLSYLLLDFGRTDHDVMSARMALYASDWTHNRSIQQVMIDVLNTYYLFLGTTALLEAKQADLKNVTESFEASKQLYLAGIKTKLDVLQAEVNVLTTKADIVDLEGRQRIALGALLTTTGLPANSALPPDVIGKLPIELPFDVVTQNIDDLIAIAKEQRPDLNAAYAQYESDKELVGVAIAAGMPTLTLEGDFQKNKILNLPQSNYIQSTVFIAFNVPIFTGFALTYDLKKAQENMRLSAANMELLTQQVMLEVLTSYYNFKTAEEAMKLDEKALEASFESYNLALAQYQDGIGTILDLLLSQQNLSTARATLVQDRTRWAIALANIAFNTGVLIPFKNNPNYQPKYFSKDEKIIQNATPIQGGV